MTYLSTMMAKQGAYLMLTHTQRAAFWHHSSSLSSFGKEQM